MADTTPAPGTPQTGRKAYVAAALAGVGTFVTAWIVDTDPFTGKEAAAAALGAAAVVAPIVGIPVYWLKNRAK